MAGLSTPFAFPFCIESSTDVGFGTDYPIGVDYETIFKWYWRVKEWSISLNSSTQSASASSGSASASSSSVTPITGVLQATRPSGLTTVETQLVCGQNYFVLQSPVSNEDYDPQSSDDDDYFYAAESFTSAFINDAILFDSFGDRIRTNSGLYYPLFLIDFSIEASGFWSRTPKNGDPGNSGYEVKGFNEGSGSGTIDLTVDGETTSFRCVQSSDSQTDTGGTASSSLTGVTISLTPTAYWPYNPGSGGDIWDSSTGAQLRDPFSVTSWN